MTEQSDHGDGMQGDGTPDGMRIEPEGARADRSGVRRRVGVGVTAVALVAAAGGVGYGLGLSFAEDDGDAGSADLVPAEEAEEAAVPVTLPPVATDATMTTDATVSSTLPPVRNVPGDDDSASSTDMYGGVVVGSPISAAGGYGYSMFGTQPMETVFERTTADGVVLRAQQGPTWESPLASDVGGAWQPPAWCYASGQLRVSLVGDGVVDVGGAGWFSEPFQGRSVSWMLLGGNDSQPHWVVVAQVPDGTTTVGATFPDGATDTVEPQNGIAVLAVIAPAGTADPMADPMQAPPVFEVTFDGGAEPIAVTAGAGTWADPEYQRSCAPPPPALPDPGEQPADPAAAEAQITDVMTRLYDGSVTGEVGLVDDDMGIADARAQVAEGSFSTEASNAQAVIEELVFTSPTEAWFRYRVDTGGAGLSNRYGIARLSDGAWRVTRDTVCQDLSMAGGDCGGGWQMVQPPSVQTGMWPGGMSEPAVIGD